MGEESVYLTLYQGGALLSRIEELEKNPYFKDPIAEQFRQEFFKQARDITVRSLRPTSNALQKLRKNGNMIEVPKGRFEYITRLTEVDVFDEEFMRQFIDKVNEISPSFQIDKAGKKR